MDDMCRQLFSSPAVTIILSDTMPDELRGKTVIWTGRIRHIDSARKDIGIEVMVDPPAYQRGGAFLEFDRSQWGRFLRLKKGQIIHFSGVIDDVNMTPSLGYLSLTSCKLLSVVQ